MRTPENEEQIIRNEHGGVPFWVPKNSCTLPPRVFCVWYFLHAACDVATLLNEMNDASYSVAFL